MVDIPCLTPKDYVQSSVSHHALYRPSVFISVITHPQPHTVIKLFVKTSCLEMKGKGFLEEFSNFDKFRVYYISRFFLFF